MFILVALTLVLGMQLSAIVLYRRHASNRASECAAVVRELTTLYGARTVSGALAPGVRLTDGWAGSVDGVSLSLSFVKTSAGRSTERSTYIDLAISSSYPLSLHICRHGFFDRRQIERAAMVDVVIGDAEFDHAFRVEAAPADIVRRILGPILRTFLLRCSTQSSLATLDRTTIRIAAPRWLNIVEAKQALAGMSELGSRLSLAFQEADAAIAVPEAGNPYRDSIVDEAPLHAARQLRIDEVAKVEALIDKRSKRGMVVVFVLFVAALAAVVRMRIAVNSPHHHRATAPARSGDLK